MQMIFMETNCLIREDKLFLLSIKEAKKYYIMDSDRRCQPTFFAYISGVDKDKDSEKCYWWLRTV